MTVWSGDMMLPGQGQRADGGPERSPARRGPSALGAPEESTFLQETEGNRDSTAGGPPLRSPGRVPALSPWASNAILFGNPSVLVLDLCLERFCFVLFCSVLGAWIFLCRHRTRDPFPPRGIPPARQENAGRPCRSCGFRKATSPASGAQAIAPPGPTTGDCSKPD